MCLSPFSLAACALAVSFTHAAHGQTINLSLNVFYTTPSNAASGGTWELVAKSSDSGLSAVNARLTNIANAQDRGPRATVNGSDPAGFSLFVNTQYPSYNELNIGQIPIGPVPLTNGKEETVFYGVGTLTNGAPNYPGKPMGSNSIGPAFTSLTNPQDIPWATGDAFGDSTWNTAARLASGGFSAGVTPAFFAGSSGQVFTSVGTSTSYGNLTPATTISTIVRTNFVAMMNADYNHNGIVDAADYVLWRQQLGTSVTPGTGADGNGDGMVNQADYDLWRSHFGLPSGAGAGGSLSTNAVPEPNAFLLLTFAAMLVLAPRRPRSRGSVNN